MDYPLRNFDASDVASAIAKAADIAIIVDSDGTIIDVAVNAAELLKLNVDQWLGQPVHNIVTVESRPKVANLLIDDLTGLRRWRQVNHPAGDEPDVPVEYAVIHIGADSSRILAGRELSGIALLQQRLISTQQSMEREYARVRNAEARYHVLFQLTSEAVLIVDAASERVVEANPAAAELFDSKPTRIVSSPFAGLLDRTDSADALALLSSVRATGATDAARLRTANGRSLAVSASLFGQSNKTFFLIRAVADSRDVAVRPASHIIDIVDRMPDGFVVCDEDGCILSANAAFMDMIQQASVEFVRGEPLSRWLGRTGIDSTVLFNALKTNDAVQRFATVIRGEHGASEDVEIAAVVTRAPQGEAYYGLAVRVARYETPRSSLGLEHSVEQLAELVGRVPLKDLVRDATDMIERMCIEAALRLTENNRASAAEMLGVSRQSLYNKMRRYDLSAPGMEADQ